MTSLGLTESGAQERGSTYNPSIASSSVDEPFGDLSGSLNDKQSAESLEKLEDGT